VSSDGAGLGGSIVVSCVGESVSATGLFAARVAQDSYGKSSSQLFAGLWSQYIAIGCFGANTNNMGLYTFTANSCAGSSISAAYRYNMPP
jgi:hypothetical protein